MRPDHRLITVEQHPVKHNLLQMRKEDLLTLHIGETLDQKSSITKCLPEPNYVIGTLSNYLTGKPSDLANFMIADGVAGWRKKSDA